MILSLQHFSQNNNRLFIGGFIVGSIVEYIISWYGDTFLHVKWWDYSDMPLNINGRICVFFSIFWGLLAIYLISYVNPKIDRLINWIKSKISSKKLKTLTATVTILLLLDCLLTGYALEFFIVRKIHENDIQVAYKEEIDKLYNKIYNDEKLSKFINKFWGDKKMIKTFPNLKTKDKERKYCLF